jgi:hypothetical protein
MPELKNLELYEFFNLGGSGSKRKPDVDVIHASSKFLVIETNDPIVYLNIVSGVDLLEKPENPHVSMIILFSEGKSVCGFENGDEILESKRGEIATGNIFDYLKGMNIQI